MRSTCNLQDLEGVLANMFSSLFERFHLPIALPELKSRAMPHEPDS